MKVGLVTTWKERCGVAEYASNLASGVVKKGIEVTVIKPTLYIDIFEKSAEMDIVHFNYVAQLFPVLSNEEFASFRVRGQKTILTLHDSTDERVRKIASLELFNALVVHENPDNEPFPERVYVIPHGLKRLTGLSKEIKWDVGTVGFPFPWKGFEAVAQVTRILNLSSLFIIPESKQADIGPAVHSILSLQPKAEIISNWLSEEEVVTKLSQCGMVIFCYSIDKELYGTSGAVKLGLASGRPTIVSECRQFKDLFAYKNELYVSRESLINTVKQVLNDKNNHSLRLPKKIMVDMDWAESVKKYVGVYETVLRSR